MSCVQQYDIAQKYIIIYMVWYHRDGKHSHIMTHIEVNRISSEQDSIHVLQTKDRIANHEL